MTTRPTTTDMQTMGLAECPACKHWSHQSASECLNCRASGTGTPWQGTTGGKVANDADKRHKGRESLLQRDCEQWLQFAGYWPRTPKYLTGEQPPKGWYIHLHQCEGNPILLDLLILSNYGWYVEIELKTATGDTTRAQEIILDGRLPIRDLQTFKGIITEAEKSL